MSAKEEANPKLRRAVVRISQYRPFGSGELEVQEARRQCVLAAADANENGFASLAECQEICRTMWGLTLDLEEVESVVKELEKDGLLKRGSAAYELTLDAREDLEKRAKDSELVEEQAFDEWERSVRAMEPDLTREQLDVLREDLDSWLEQIIVRQGVEAAMLLYPEESRAEELYGRIESLGFESLPARSGLVGDVREKALYAFISDPTTARRSYLANLMTTAYMVAVFTIDPEAHELVKGLTAGQRIYLDTNLIYDILNLSGVSDYLQTRRILEMSRSLGYEICVTPWTVAEMKESVRRAREKLSKTKLPPRELADLAAKASGDESFVTAYWRKYKETGVKPDDFLDFHEQIEGLLEDTDIKIVDQGCTAIDKMEDAIREQESLLGSIQGAAGKPPPVLEHDAKHRLLVERLRGDGRRFSNAGYWFLTKDRTLIPYAASRLSKPDQLHFAVSLQAWAHIVRSLCPRTTDYDQTLVDLLDTPAARPRSTVSYATISEVLGRVEMMVKDSTAEVAARVLLDSAALDRIGATESEADREKLIGQTVEAKKSEMQRELSESQQALEETEAKLKEAELAQSEQETKLAKQAESAAEALRSRDARSDEALAALRAEADEREARLKQKSEMQQEKLEALEGQFSSQKQLIRYAVGGVIALLGLAVLLVPLLTGAVDDGWPLVGVIAAAAALLAIGGSFFVGKKLMWQAIVGASVVGGLIGGLYTVVSSDDAPPTPKSKTNR